MVTTGSDFDDRFRFDRFQPGDAVTVVEGPFHGFDGTVIETDDSLQVAVVEIPVFGKTTPVPLRYHEIARPA